MGKDIVQLVTVIVPCFNEEEMIGAFTEVLFGVLAKCPSFRWRILFVDDGSTDGTASFLSRLAADDERVDICRLSRNFGHQVAISAGLDFAQGDAVLILDCDLQHPPLLIPEMLKEWKAGHDIVSALRRQTSRAFSFKALSSRIYYRIINSISTTHVVANCADFCLLSRVVYQALRRMPERHRLLRGMISWMGFSRAFVTYDAPPRFAGQSKYTFIKMLRLAFDGIVSFSTVPLKFAFYLSGAMAFAAFACCAGSLYSWQIAADALAGWLLLACIVLIVGGANLLCLGIVGEYLGRVFDEVKGRPLYLLNQRPTLRRLRSARQLVGSHSGEKG